MSQEFDAIYENGVLRPLKPIALREHDVVTVSVAQASAVDNPELGARQREVLLSFTAEMESLADSGVGDDGFSNRQHDQQIYGEPPTALGSR